MLAESDDARFSDNSVLRDPNEIGVAEVSSSLYENVTRYHAQIGQNVNRDELQQLEWNLLGEAKMLFHQRKFEEALNTFTHCLAVTEKTRSAKDHAVRGAVIHNIASCLHNLGEMEAAQAYYEQAIDAFKKAKVPMIERVIYGDANKRRVDFVKERLVDITWGRKPDGDKYLDENGLKRAVPGGLAPEDSSLGDTHLSEEWRSAEPRLPNWAAAEGGDRTPYAPRDDGFRGPAPAVREEAYQATPSYEQAPYQHGSYGGAAHSAHDSRGDEPADDEQELARKEWLQYHMETGEWDKAAELVVTKEEREDLDYLMQRQRRMGSDAAPGRPTVTSARKDAPAPTAGHSTRGRAADEEEDQML